MGQLERRGPTELGSAAGATASAGGAVVAAVASVCCSVPAIGPLLVAWFGVGGAVALARLHPYAPLLIAGSGILLGWSFWRTYRRVQCAHRILSPRARFSAWLLWLSAAVWLVAAITTVYGSVHR